MEYQTTTNLVDDTASKTLKYWTKSWIKINDDRRGVYGVGHKIKFKTTMIKSSLYDYSDAQIFVSGTIAINGTDAAKRQTNKRYKQAILDTFWNHELCTIYETKWSK